MCYMAEQQDSFDSAAEILCEELREIALLLPEGKRRTIQEIRMRSGKPLCFTDGSSGLFMDNSGRILYSPGENTVTVTRRHVYDTFRRLCSYSIHSFQQELKNGYITVRGGHRVGICGTAVLENEKLSTVTDISSLNIRISRQVFGVSESVIKQLVPLRGGVLVVGAPGSGKTTLLRDLAYRLSRGIGCKMQRVCVIDERGELAGTYSGQACNDLGFCDIFNGYPKGDGILQAIRSMSPQVIICDELGGTEDCTLTEQGFHAGAFMVASIHAPSLQELLARKQARQLLKTGAFRSAVLLRSSDHPCEVAEILDLSKEVPALTASLGGF